MQDVETTETVRLRDGSKMKPISTGLPPRHPINLLYRVLVIIGSLYVLHEMDVYHQVTRGNKVRHEWFKVGLAASVAIEAIKGYVELYEGKLLKRKIEYQTYKHSTHAIILLILIAWLAFDIALWPAYGGFKTFFIMGLFGYGILLQSLLLVPTLLHNFVSIVLMTLFIQQYK